METMWLGGPSTISVATSKDNGHEDLWLNITRANNCSCGFLHWSGPTVVQVNEQKSAKSSVSSRYCWSWYMAWPNMYKWACYMTAIIIWFQSKYPQDPKPKWHLTMTQLFPVANIATGWRLENFTRLSIIGEGRGDNTTASKVVRALSEEHERIVS